MLGTSTPVLISIIRILLIIGQIRRSRLQAIALAMISREKQLTGFYECEAPHGHPSGHRRSAINH